MGLPTENGRTILWCLWYLYGIYQEILGDSPKLGEIDLISGHWLEKHIMIHHGILIEVPDFQIQVAIM